MSTKQLKQDTVATLRGIKKVYQISVGVFEALAWGGLLAVAYTIVYKEMEGSLELNMALFAAVAFSAIVITLRLLVEGAKYFREIGKE
jgi:hypothetical protein